MAAIPTTVVFIDTAAAARDVCKPLLEAAADAADGGFDVRIALDLEGRDLGPSGQIAVVSVATSLHSVALFDFADRWHPSLFEGPKRNRCSLNPR